MMLISNVNYAGDYQNQQHKYLLINLLIDSAYFVYISKSNKAFGFA